jgi:hypothetical protein
VLVPAAVRQLTGEAQGIDLLRGGPDSVERDVLPHCFRDREIDLEPAMLAVLGVLPREKPVPGGVVLRGHFHGGSAHGEHVRSEVEVLRDE